MILVPDVRPSKNVIVVISITLNDVGEVDFVVVGSGSSNYDRSSGI